MSTIVVATREEACNISQLVARWSKHSAPQPNINVQIVDELSSATICHHASADMQSLQHDIIPLSHAVSATHPGYDKVLRKNISGWMLLVSSELQILSNSSLLRKLRDCHLNLVSLSGQIFLADGEVRSSCHWRQLCNSSANSLLEAMVGTTSQNVGRKASSPRVPDHKCVDMTVIQQQYNDVISKQKLVEKSIDNIQHKHMASKVEVETIKQEQSIIQEQHREILHNCSEACEFATSRTDQVEQGVLDEQDRNLTEQLLHQKMKMKQKYEHKYEELVKNFTSKGKAPFSVLAWMENVH